MSNFDIGAKLLHTGPAGTVSVQYRGRIGDTATVVFPGGMQHSVPLERLSASPAEDAPPEKPRGGRPALSPDGRTRYRCNVTLPPDLGDYIEARVAAGEKRSAVVEALCVAGLEALESL